jgi:hypothetical protein
MGARLVTLRVYVREEGRATCQPDGEGCPASASGRLIPLNGLYQSTKELGRDPLLKKVQLGFWKCEKS